ncbi:MAG TPA: hypothetical protein VI873_00125, partial [Candidatus Peribacteraceae bacterium]|nr:hypothetical protein [Candidatus Peribacteraceae bacterium]
MPRTRRKTKRKVRTRSSLELKSSTQAAIWGTVQISFGILLFLALEQKAGMAGNAVNSSLTFFFGAWGAIFPVFL